jgi:hypothetical protein
MKVEQGMTGLRESRQTGAATKLSQFARVSRSELLTLQRENLHTLLEMRLARLECEEILLLPMSISKEG